MKSTLMVKNTKTQIRDTYVGDISGLLGSVLIRNNSIQVAGKNYRIINGSISKEALARLYLTPKQRKWKKREDKTTVLAQVRDMNDLSVHSVGIEVTSTAEAKKLKGYLTENGFKHVGKDKDLRMNRFSYGFSSTSTGRFYAKALGKALTNVRKTLGIILP